jgi:hypothetical protein
MDTPLINKEYAIMKNQNKIIMTYATAGLMALLSSLEAKYKAHCSTDKTQADIALALKSRNEDLVNSLNILAKITTLLAIPKAKGNICEDAYPYQGSETLYNLLDKVRHEYRMLDLSLRSNGIHITEKEATNNLMFA